MKEENITSKKASINENMPFDTSAYIRQVSLAGSKEEMSKPVQANNQPGMPIDMPEPAEEKPAKRKRQTVDYENRQTDLSCCSHKPETALEDAKKFPVKGIGGTLYRFPLNILSFFNLLNITPVERKN